MNDKLQCLVCEKYYKSISSFCNHKKKKHPDYKALVVQNINNLGQNGDNLVQKINNLEQSEALNNTPNNTCEYCNKQLSCYKSLMRHKNICKSKKSMIKENNELKIELDNLKNNTIKEMALLREQIKELINTRNKIHPKTLQKMINNSNNNNNSNNTINNTNNGTINIIALGKENIPTLFNTDEKMEVLNKKNNALYHLIEKVHFNEKYPQFQSLFITNNRNNEAHLYDVNSHKFKIVDKEEVINDMIEYRVCDIEEFYEELGDKLDQRAKDILEDLFRERGDDNITRDKVKLLIYNNKTPIHK
jgi:hypothetical protein